MNQTLEKNRTTDQYPFTLMFTVYLIQAVFFVYIDEGHHSLHQYEDVGTWLFTFGETLVFLLMGWAIYTLFNRMTSLDQFPKVVLSVLLTIPVIFLFLSTIFLVLMSFRGIISLF